MMQHQVYPEAPSIQRGRQTILTLWACAECGRTKYANCVLRKKKYCSRRCFGLAHSRHMAGAKSPLYTGGQKLKREGRTDRLYTRIPAYKVRAVMQWVDARDALGTADDVAERLRLPKQAVYHTASHYRRKLRMATT
jgi:hypothetical protein